MKREWECQNCGATLKHDEDELPPGWRWFGMAGNLEGIFDQLETPLICLRCVGAVEVALESTMKKRAAPKPSETVDMAVTVRKIARALGTVPMRDQRETHEQFTERMNEWYLLFKETIDEAANEDWIRRIRGHIEGRKP